MIEDLILDATAALINQQRGKLLNKALHTEEAANKFIPKKVLNTINSHRKVGALVALLPGGMLGTLASVWHMYYSINKIIGIRFNKNLVKSIAAGIASNMAGFLTASFILDKIPFANFLNAPIMYGATCVQGFVYIKILTALNSTSGEDVSKVISNVIRENTVLIKQLLGEFLGDNNKVQTRKSVSLNTLERRRIQKAIDKKNNALAQFKYIGISMVLGLVGLWYCSNNLSYTRGVTDIWITSYTSTSWNLWWYFWGFLVLISVFVFLYCLWNVCFGFADYYKIKSTPLSQFAEQNEYLIDEKPLEDIIQAELRSLHLNKVAIILSHFIIGTAAVILAFLFFFYCATHPNSQMITVKNVFMDASTENDINYVWYILLGSGLLTCYCALKNIYIFVVTSVTMKMKRLMYGILSAVAVIVVGILFLIFYPRQSPSIYENNSNVTTDALAPTSDQITTEATSIGNSQQNYTDTEICFQEKEEKEAPSKDLLSMAKSCKATIENDSQSGKWTFSFKNTCGYPVRVECMVYDNGGTQSFTHNYHGKKLYRDGDLISFTLQNSVLSKMAVRANWTVSMYKENKLWKMFGITCDYGKNKNDWFPIFGSAGSYSENSWVNEDYEDY